MSLSTSMGCEDAPNDDDEKSRFIVRRPDCGCFGLNMLASDVDPDSESLFGHNKFRTKTRPFSRARLT